MNWQSITTAVLFTAFILMGILLYWPRRGDKPYKDAEKLALKDDDEIITPRQDKKS
ncbi:CcoQ/FixQ family Cbb3-type cytochrome c oxidase assembly chaperone [Cardiobacteriaceae bacterium TAE3-ERU3]|nr:CcoQ/FixQ family Cbb3-type cytochrome c oxidase assembly chaperone [Cardiobacteriaceae bacterium TAE3-ERU3]